MNTEVALAIWIAGGAALLYRGWSRKTPLAGLAICYWLNLASVHILTEGLCLFYVNTSDYRLASAYAFPLTAYAIVGLLIGNLLLPQALDRLLPQQVPAPGLPRNPAADVLMAQAAIVVGMLVFLVGNVFNIPSLSSVLVSGNMLATAGFAWWWWAAYSNGHRSRAWGILAASLSIPISILVLHGFLSFGVFAVLALASFVIVQFRERTVLATAAVPLFYLALSTGVTYLHGRVGIRQSVWYEQSEMSRRSKVIGKVFNEGWQWFDPTDESQRQALDARFNQNYFIGLAALRIDSGQMAYAQGETIANAFLALVPRIIWRNKPVYVGGSENMSRFTGRHFSGTTTFGLGHVMEAYVNYGRTGLVVCFAVLGAFIGVMDIRTGRQLRTGRFDSFLMWYVPGTALLNGGVGSFPELTGGFAGSIVLIWGFRGFFRMFIPPEPPRTLISGSSKEERRIKGMRMNSTQLRQK